MLNDPQFDVILSNFPSSKDYGLLLAGIVLRGPSSNRITRPCEINDLVVPSRHGTTRDIRRDNEGLPTGA